MDLLKLSDPGNFSLEDDMHKYIHRGSTTSVTKIMLSKKSPMEWWWRVFNLILNIACKT